MVPAGIPVTLREGKTRLHHASPRRQRFTVYVEGNLFRIPGKDADALGKEPSDRAELPPNATDEDVKRAGVGPDAQLLRPEIPINIVELGLVYTV